MGQQHDFVIFLEEDLIVAPDFLTLFRSTAWLLREDPSIWCVSAWNDVGFELSAFRSMPLVSNDIFFLALVSCYLGMYGYG